MSDPPQSPSKDVEQAAQSPEDDGQLNEAQEAQVLMEYEGVKEQDRWLPIANGRLHCLEPIVPLSGTTCASCGCWTSGH